MHLHGLPLGAAQAGLGHEEGSVGVQSPHAQDSWESVKCSLFPHSRSELTFYTCNFDVVS